MATIVVGLSLDERCHLAWMRIDERAYRRKNDTVTMLSAASLLGLDLT